MSKDAKFWHNATGYGVEPVECDTDALRPYHPDESKFNPAAYRAEIYKVKSKDIFVLELQAGTGWSVPIIGHVDQLRFRPTDDSFETLVAKPKTPLIYDEFQLVQWTIRCIEDGDDIIFLDVLDWDPLRRDSVSVSSNKELRSVTTSWRWKRD